MADVREWLKPDETAKDLLTRVLTERPPLLLPPPLHRLPLRAGNVVEIAGPSASAKTQILIQVAVHCILPKQWRGVNYGGLERSVMFLDLDCRFDILRLLELLKHRIADAKGSRREAEHEQRDYIVQSRKTIEDSDDDNHLVEMCLHRFLYTRCYDSFEFLATLKTLNFQLTKVRSELGANVHLLMIDSIGAYYWVDRASTSFPLGANNRKTFSLQSVTEAVVREIQNCLLVNPMLVLATKAAIFSDKSLTNEIKRTLTKRPSKNTSGQSSSESGPGNSVHREYMPSAWQSLVSHRILVHSSNSLEDGPNYKQVCLAEWLLPSLGLVDKIELRDTLVRLCQPAGGHIHLSMSSIYDTQ